MLENELSVWEHIKDDPRGSLEFCGSLAAGAVVAFGLVYGIKTLEGETCTKTDQEIRHETESSMSLPHPKP